RIGQELDSDFGPPRIRPGLPGSEAFRPDGPRIRPGLPGSEAFTPDGGFAWYLFAGAEGQVVLRNIFLDGNTFQDSHSVDRRVLVGDLQAGFALIYESWRLTYTHVLRTPEFEEQKRRRSFRRADRVVPLLGTAGRLTATGRPAEG